MRHQYAAGLGNRGPGSWLWLWLWHCIGTNLWRLAPLFPSIPFPFLCSPKSRRLPLHHLFSGISQPFKHYHLSIPSLSFYAIKTLIFAKNDLLHHPSVGCLTLAPASTSEVSSTINSSCFMVAVRTPSHAIVLPSQYGCALGASCHHA